MLYYIIPTSIKYKDVVLKKLLDSLNGTKNPIIVAINESRRQKIVVEDNITYYYLKCCSFDYAAPIAALKMLYANDYFFWFHDTCEVGPNFDGIVNSFPYEKYDFVDVYNGYCNFGIYSVRFIQKDANWVLSQKRITKDQAVKNEFRYWQNFKSSNHTRFYPRENVDCYKQLEQKDVYGLGTQRLVEYYGSIDLYKYKANWYQKPADKWTIST